MNVFGIGFTGFIGSAVAERLLKDGHELTGLARSDSAAKYLEEANIRVVRGELGDVEIISDEAKKADAIFILCGGAFLTTRFCPEGAVWASIQAVFNAVEGTGKPVVLIGGTGCYFGKTTEEPLYVVTEKDPFYMPPFYKEVKDTFEGFLKESTERGIRGMIVHPAQVYGKGGGYIGQVARRFDCARKYGCVNVLLTDKIHWVTYSHVEDLAELFVLAMEKGRAGGQYFSGTDTENMYNISRAVSKVCGFGGRVEPVSAEMMTEMENWACTQDFKMDLIVNSYKTRQELGWIPKHPGVVEELEGLVGKVNMHEVYPMKSRKAVGDLVNANLEKDKNK